MIYIGIVSKSYELNMTCKLVFQELYLSISVSGRNECLVVDFKHIFNICQVLTINENFHKEFRVRDDDESKFA